MVSSESSRDYILDQLINIENVHSSRMFGEYVIYIGDKVVGLVCDNILYIKKTEQAEKFLGELYVEGTPFKGARPWIEISDEILENREMIAEIILITEENVKEVKRKK